MSSSLQSVLARALLSLLSAKHFFHEAKSFQRLAQFNLSIELLKRSYDVPALFDLMNVIIMCRYLYVYIYLYTYHFHVGRVG